MKYRTLFVYMTALCLTLSACAGNVGGNAENTSQTVPAVLPEATTAAPSAAETADPVPDASELFTARDFDAGYSDCTKITLSDSGTDISGEGASVGGNVVTITEKGSYIVSGTLSDGRIVIDAGNEKVQIVLDNASLAFSGGAALYVKSADKVFVTLADGSTNTLAFAGETAGNGEPDTDGAVFARSDITFNGGGKLAVMSGTAHGIVCKDDLKVTSGNITITAAKKGADCNKSIRAAGGDITVTSGTDGFHAGNAKDPSKGFIFIGGGNITVESGGDAFDASGEVAVTDGTVFVTSNEGAGIKSDSLITVGGGTLGIDSAGDALHSKGSVRISSGAVTARSGDDGIHAVSDIFVSGGAVEVTESLEGMEGKAIEISGGTVKIRASDDGMNAAGGSDGKAPKTDGNAKITVSGGEVYINADGDGLDSNGYLTVSGGKLFVSGPTDRFNGTLDHGISSVITGGYVVAAGSAEMAVNFGSGSTQGSILYIFDEVLPA